MQTYIVKEGDTLYGISGQFGVPIQDIKDVNNLTSNSVAKGDALKIPTTETTIIYIVRRGDSLYSIAQKYNTTVAELININDLKSANLTIGQELRIPIKTESNYITYTVVKGDDLYSIANKYNTTVNEVKKLNNLSTNLLSIGQKLKIPIKNMAPIPEVDYMTYIVQSGDSLYKIAKEFNMTVNELMEINNLKNTNLTIGQLLKVKKTTSKEQPGIIEECFGEGYIKPTYQMYTVKSGDSLYTIAKKYNTSIENLRALNGLNTDDLSIGQVLKIKEITQ